MIECGLVFLVCGIQPLSSAMATVRTCATVEDGRPQHGRSAAIGRIKNDDIEWIGTFVGLAPVLRGKTYEVAKSVRKDDIPLLVKALEDKERRVAAHVLLAQVSRARGLRGPTEWHGIKLTLMGDGSVVFDETSLKNLPHQWKLWLSEESSK